MLLSRPEESLVDSGLGPARGEHQIFKVFLRFLRKALQPFLDVLQTYRALPGAGIKTLQPLDALIDLLCAKPYGINFLLEFRIHTNPARQSTPAGWPLIFSRCRRPAGRQSRAIASPMCAGR